MALRLLQVCNVGRIVGGTGACAWSVTRALPDVEHRVLFLSPPDAETAAAFSPVEITHQTALSPEVVDKFRPNVVLLHNTSRGRISGAIDVPTLLYLHSAIADSADADETVCCSHWLARKLGLPAGRVLWQGVPCAGEGVPREAADDGKALVVGRICTPVARKWPKGLVSFYGELARRCPELMWEFVGCPDGLQAELQLACRQRSAFHQAGWGQRSLLARWDVMLYSQPELPESFGRTVAEAMQVGCVPVMDRLGGFVEQVPWNAGYLCSAQDEFVAALRWLLRSENRREMSGQAVRHANQMFSLERFGERLRNWLKRVQERYAAGRG